MEKAIGTNIEPSLHREVLSSITRAFFIERLFRKLDNALIVENDMIELAHLDSVPYGLRVDSRASGFCQFDMIA